MSNGIALQRRVCMCTSILLSTAALSAQPECIDSWQARFGTPNDDQILTSIRDSAGNTYLGGYEGGLLGVENFWPVGNSKGFVEKRTASGMLLWRYDFDTPDTDIVESIALDSDERVIVAGRTSGSFPGQANGGQFDLFLGLLDADGQLIVVQQFGDDRPQHPVAVAVLQDGAVVIAGYDDIFVVGSAVMDWENGFVTRFDIDATNAITITWSLQPNLPQTDLITSIVSAVDGSGDFFVSDLNSTWPANGGGVHVKRVDAQGNDVWAATVSPLSMDYIASLAMSGDGKLFVAGTTVGQVAGPPLGNSDGFILELDPNTGALLHGRQIGTPGGDWIYSMSVDSSGTLALAGTTNEGIAVGYQGDGSYGPFVLALSPNESIVGVWQPDPPAVFAEETLLVMPTACNGTAVIAGSATFGLPGLPSIGREDAMVLTIPLIDSIFHDGFENAGFTRNPQGQR